MSEVFKSKQLIGIELEVYANGGVDGVRRFVERNEMEGLSVCGDGSLGWGGAEIKFAQGTPLDKAKEQIESMYKIATDSATLDTKFRSRRNNRYLPSDKSIPAYDGYGGTTGLHIHFNAGAGYNPLDVMRLGMQCAYSHHQGRQTASSHYRE
jgi:hypothetical protein